MAWNPRIPPISTQKVINNLYYAEQLGGEFVPLLLPRVTPYPVFSSAYAGYNVYNTYRNEYKATQDLPRADRIKRIAVKTGDVTLFHLASTLLIPLVLMNKTHQVVEKLVRHPVVPKLMKRWPVPEAITALVLTIISMITGKPVNTAVNFVMDRTYRPLFLAQQKAKAVKEAKKEAKKAAEEKKLLKA